MNYARKKRLTETNSEANKGGAPHHPPPESAADIHVSVSRCYMFIQSHH